MMKIISTGILVMLIVFQQSAVSQDRRMPAAEVWHTCDIQQGFHFDSDQQTTIGHLISLKVGSTVIPADLTVKIPTNSLLTRSVVGVVAVINWPGGLADPIDITAQVSTANKQRISTMLHSALTNTNVEFKFEIYDYDPMEQTYYRCFYTNEVLLFGIIRKIGPELQMFIENIPNDEVPSPQNYTLTVSVVPQIISQTISYAVGYMMDISKQWGLNESSVPVELSSFSAIAKGRDIEVRWATATETNNHGFEVERKESNHRSNGLMNQWLCIGFVEGNGSSNIAHEYRFDDWDVRAGTYAYRLKQFDRDGSFRYSEPVEVGVVAQSAAFSLEQNYPNPFNPSTAIGFTLKESGMTTLTVYDIVGREAAVLVNEVKDAGSYSVPFDASHLANGLYIARLTSGGKSEMKKMMLIK